MCCTAFLEICKVIEVFNHFPGSQALPAIDS